jgi:uncharacterized protein (DUF427 family)
MKAQWQGRVIASDDAVVELDGYYYFPRASVRMELLSPTPRTAADQRCPHGVQFFHLSDGIHKSERAAWSYEAPRPAYAHVDHWIGFWEDVELLP